MKYIKEALIQHIKRNSEIETKTDKKVVYKNKFKYFNSLSLVLSYIEELEAENIVLRERHHKLQKTFIEQKLKNKRN